MPFQSKTRDLADQIRRRLDAEIVPIVMVRGPDQVGKTTAQFQLIEDLLKEGTPARSILRVQFDVLATLKTVSDPILKISDWFEREIAPERFNTLARHDTKACLFFDEIQHVHNWGAQLKSLVDNASVKVVVSGGLAMDERMGRDSLAGRISTIEVRG